MADADEVDEAWILLPLVRLNVLVEKPDVMVPVVVTVSEALEIKSEPAELDDAMLLEDVAEVSVVVVAPIAF